MGASAGRYGVNIGTGAAGGAATGSMFGPVGAVVGGGIGAIGGALSTLLSSSDEAKQREKAKQEYLRQQQERAQEEHLQRFAAITGLNSNPMYIALSEKPYDAQKASADFDAAMPDEPTPNYGALVQSLGSLGGTIGGQVRADSLANYRNESNQMNNISATGNPWANDAISEQDDALEELLENARRNSPGLR